MRSHFLSAVFCAASLGLGPGLAVPAAAQGLFSPRVYVNNAAVTQYEVDQRARFIEVIGSSTDSEREALNALIDDRLYQSAARQFGITVEPAQIAAGIGEFASRGGLTSEEFTARMAEEGIAEETLRDFVRSGILWREVVRARFAGRVQVTESEIGRAMQAEAQRPGIEIALSEIILPMVPQYAEQSRQIAALIEAEVTTPELFAEAARRFSASGSREDGGALDWMPISNLPPALASRLRQMRPGEISEPIEVPNAVAYFLMRGTREGARPPASAVTVDYAELLIPGPRESALAQAAAISARVDGCDDLYDEVRGIEPSPLRRQSLPMGQVPGDVGLALAGLDRNEISTAVSRPEGTLLVMLCSRVPQAAEPPTREAVRARLLDQRYAQLAANYLAELRAAAIVREP